MIPNHCPLCQSMQSSPLLAEPLYWLCNNCKFIWMDRNKCIALEVSRSHYLHHQNTLSQPSYRNYLEKTLMALDNLLAPSSQGLDFGCGQSLALAELGKSRNWTIDSYDPIFHPHFFFLEKNTFYDFVVCQESVEHFHQPYLEFERISKLIKPGGWLAIRTSMPPDDPEKFQNWHYRIDPTHISFYRSESFCWIAKNWGWENPLQIRTEFWLLRKNAKLEI